MLDREQLWVAMRSLLDRVVTSLDRATFLDECLDTLVDLFDADRGLLLLSDSYGATCVINARGQGRALTPAERAEISGTIVDKVQRTGECVLWEPAAGGAYAESINTLGISAALAAPLKSIAWHRGAGQDEDEGARFRPFTRGVLYLDFRNFEKVVGGAHRELLEAAAALVSVVLEQAQRIEIAREHLREAELNRAPTLNPVGLDELLRAPSAAPLRREVESALHSDTPILITGESGTGKTLLASAIASASSQRPVVRAVLGSSEDLNTITSELFGHNKGSFSGAFTKRTGLVEHADGGVLILDEILNLPLHAQQLLLDFTQFGSYRPLGYEQPDPKQAQVRIIACTNGDLDLAVSQGRFREDLYYRIAGVRLEIPPLRERRADIPPLAEGFLRRLDPSRAWRLSVSLRRLLVSDELPWRGNVRQLESVIRRARDRAFSEDPSAAAIEPRHVEPRDLGVAALEVPPPTAVVERGEPLCTAFQIEPGELGDSWKRLQAERGQIEQLERRVISQVLALHGGVVAHAARELGMRRSSLVSRIRTLGVDAGTAAIE